MIPSRSMSSQVIVTHRVPGFHFWPGADGDVSYQANRHRHQFLFVVAWDVARDDMDVEFHTAQNWIRKTFEANTDFGAKSCEMIAKDLAMRLAEAGHKHPAWIEVCEDGEVGLRVRVEFDI